MGSGEQTAIPKIQLILLYDGAVQYCLRYSIPYNELDNGVLLALRRNFKVHRTGVYENKQLFLNDSELITSFLTKYDEEGGWDRFLLHGDQQEPSNETFILPCIIPY